MARNTIKGKNKRPKSNKATGRNYSYDKKYQASKKRKRYRAQLNKYNRKKGTYGNKDGKDALHKGGKIVGMGDASTNRGRKEKSRLKGYKRNKR